MFKVTKDEAEYIRKNAKDVRVTVTGKGKISRQKNWYVDESMECLHLLQEYKDNHNVESFTAN